MAFRPPKRKIMKGPTGGCVGPRPHRKSMKGGSANIGSTLASKRACVPQKRLPAVSSGSIIASRRRSEENRGVGGGIVGALDPCDNSNDSGLGFDHPSEIQKVQLFVHPTASSSQLPHFDGQEESWDNHCPEVKKQCLGIKMEKIEEGANDCFSVFSVSSRNTSQSSELRTRPIAMATLITSNAIRPVTQARTVPTPAKTQSHKRKSSQGSGGSGSHSGTVASSLILPTRGADGNYPLTAQLPSSFLIKNESGPPALAQLLILAQPESQHRARYQTEGSRGAVKDRSGNGFPIVKLVGFNGPAKLQVFIGTDLGRVAPHMFYQACRVSGKNSTPCSELKVDGTILIEVDFDPAKDMVITCDCVGILKERNVDVEHRFPEQSAGRSKKKSTRCRMVFRANLKLPNGTTETLQTISQPIVCTQPPGVPEICKKSLTGCGCGGGAELFILGKNFLKDTRVVFRMGRDVTRDGDDGGGGSAGEDEDGGSDTGEPLWEEQVIPDREFLQPTHLVCVVPPYRRQDITSPVQVRLLVTSSGKKSEAHTFTYAPEGLPAQTLPQAPMAKVLLGQRGSGISTATPPTTPLASPTKIAPAICTLGTVTSSSLVVPSETSREGLCDGKMAVTLIAPALGSAVTMGTAVTQHPDHMHQGIPLISSAKDRVHPVVLWSTEGSSGTEVIKVLSGPIKLPTAVVPTESDVHLPLTETLAGPRACASQKETTSVSSTTVTDNIPKAQGNLMVSSSSEASLIQQFVSNNISCPLPAQSGQSVEKFLSRIEGEVKPNTEVKVEATQSLVSGELPLKNTTAIVHTNASSPVTPPLPPNLAMHLASMMQAQPLEQKLVVDEHVDSIASENPPAVSPHRLVIDSLNHTLTEVLTNSTSSTQSETTSPIKEDQVETVSPAPSTPCLAFVKPDQSMSDIPITTDMCTSSIGSSLTVAPAKICSKEELGLCELSLVSALSSNPIAPEVTSSNISQTIDQSCMMNMQDSSISLTVPMQTNCAMTSDALAAALTDGSLGAPPQDPMPQTIPQLNLEHSSTMPIVTSAAIMHEVMTSQQGPSSQKETIAELNHGCTSMPANGSMSLSVANAVTSASLVPSIEHALAVQTDDLQISSGMMSSSCSSVSSHSNESIGVQCQNLSIDSHVEVLATSQMNVCQNILQTVDKVSCSPDTIPLPNVNSVSFPVLRMPVHPLARKDIEDQHRAQSRVAAAMERVLKEEIPPVRILTEEENATPQTTSQPQLQLAVTVGPKKCGEDGGMVPQELTQMSDHDLLSYINPSCFDQV
ncbi:nuclear factor of activated T-cells 5 isoform X2 [Hetaerina americana]|uniref:nuclear factor of activated T-cells 5 isoform X2 n=1 Tax=Hetaerina americana TaxID=62018 RepID=UPI003A7F60BB